MSVSLGLRLSMACFALLSAAGIGSAQVKVGVVDLQKAVLSAAEIKKASDAMGAKFRPRQAQLETLQKEIAAIQQNLNVNGDKLTAEAVADLNAQGTKKGREAQRLNEDLQGDVERERNEVLSRSTQKMQDIIKKVAEEKALDMVVDVSNTLFFKSTLEITNDVLAAYDKAYPAK
jgi:outer membrane protein